MSGSLAELCTWAASLDSGAVPADVLQNARLQQVALAGAARQLAALPSLAGRGNDASGRVARFLAVPFDDHLPGGRPGFGAGPAAWEAAGGSLGDLLTAMVAANEVAGRIGLATTYQRAAGSVDIRVPRVAAAVVRARFAGVKAAEMERAVLGALGGTTALSPAEAATGSSAASIASGRSEAGELGADALPALAPPVRSWLTRQLGVGRFPGLPANTVALDGLDVILGRHLRAGEKRLRLDQVERIEVRVAFGPEAMQSAVGALSPPSLGAYSLAEAMALLVAHHELGVGWLEAGASGERAADVAGLAERVSVVHDWKLSVRKALALSAALGPVLGGQGRRKAVRAGLSRLNGLPDADAVLAALREQPWTLFAGLGRTGGLEACELESAAVWPTEIKLYTTRGGWWPERRRAATGVGSDLEAAARARFGNDTAASALLSLPLSTPAQSFVAELLA